jgi:glyoxylase-like metal-dependent hydrolase (beta-lactamase superfamily II)
VNCYLLAGDRGWTIVDTGLNTPSAQEVWHEAFAELGISKADIQQVVLTHVHPDHYGMAGWLQTYARVNGVAPQVPVYLSPIEARQVRRFWGANANWRDPLVEHWQQHGVPDALAATLADSTYDTRQRIFPQPSELTLIEPGTEIKMGNRTFEALHMPGHSDGQLIYYDAADQLLLCGDQVLTKITPNIGLWPMGDRDPLGSYLDAIQRMSKLDVRLALPGHRDLIHDLRGRIAELERHHADRLALTLTAVSCLASAFEVSHALFDFPGLSAHEMRFAIAETLAHLEYLVERKRIRRTEGTPTRYLAA